MPGERSSTSRAVLPALVMLFATFITILSIFCSNKGFFTAIFTAFSWTSFLTSCKVATVKLGSLEETSKNGVAIISTYGRLKAALAILIDEARLGLIRYGIGHLAGRVNGLEFITTKQAMYQPERELRAWVTVCNPLEGGNRHFDLNKIAHALPLEINQRHSWVEFTRRRIRLGDLITEAVISPWAEPDAVEEIKLWVNCKKFPAVLRQSDLAGTLTPALDEFRTQMGIANLPDEVDVPATAYEVQQFYDVVATLEPSRVRFLYKQRWETCRMVPGRIPRISDIQYLEATVRVLDDFRKKGINVA